MNIAAALAWYDETAETLSRCVRSLAGLADVVVACPGRWDGFPEPANENWRDSEAILDAILDPALAHEARCVFVPDPEVWPSQVAKRDALMREASRHADWILVVDADEWIEPPEPTRIDATAFGDPEPRFIDGESTFDRTKFLLAHTTLDVATVGFRNVSGSNQQPSRIRRVYRAPVTVEKSHHGYRTPDGRWLHGYPDHVHLEPALDLPISLLHDPLGRLAERRIARRAYYEHRRRHQTERWT